MKTFVLILVLLCVFIHTAEGLQCTLCNRYSSCDQTPQNCSESQTFCFSRATTDFYDFGMYTQHQVEKGCASHDMCTSTGSHVMSHDIGSMAHVTNTTCCNTDNCNDAVVVYLLPPPPAGPLQCYGCDPRKQECIANMTCRDHEACFQSSPSPYSGHQAYYGCISENMCSNSSLSTLYGVDHVSCCNTSHCNVPELGIQCQTCADYSCSSQRSVFCSNYTTMCHSQFRSGTYYHGMYTYTSLEKGCASSETCPSTGSHLSSHNIGSESILTYTSCCDTDNCNNNDTDVSVPSPGSLQCYGCDMYEDHCTANLTCHEHETCFKSSTHYNNELHFGCISENACSNSGLSTLYGLNNVSCCNTSHCNVPELAGHKCMACSDHLCSSERSVFCTKDAPFCHSRRYSHRSDYTYIQKGCAQSNICPATVENQVVSFNVGYNSVIIHITCCDTDNCNGNHTLPMISAGSLQCYTCDPYSHKCNVDTVTCNEVEVCAMTSADSSARIYGCVSENLCNNATMTAQYFGYNEEISCCDTDFCNDQNKIEDCTVFSSAGPVLSLSVPLCLLGIFTRTF